MHRLFGQYTAGGPPYRAQKWVVYGTARDAAGFFFDAELRLCGGRPSVKVFNRRAVWTSVSPGAGNPGFERTAGPEELSRNSVEGNLQPAAPGRVGLPGVRSDTDVDESLPGWSLNEGTSESGHAVEDPFFERWLEFEDQVLTLGALCLDHLIGGARALLQREIDARRRLLEDDPKDEFTTHTLEFISKRQPILDS